MNSFMGIDQKEKRGGNGAEGEQSSGVTKDVVQTHREGSGEVTAPASRGRRARQHSWRLTFTPMTPDPAFLNSR